MLKRTLTAVLSALIVALIVPGLFGQETTAGLQGIVKDSSNAVIPKAAVEVTSPALIGSKKMDTDEGYFRFSNLPPGIYTVSVTATGFRTLKHNIELAVGRLPTMDIVMQVGAITETVE